MQYNTIQYIDQAWIYTEALEASFAPGLGLGAPVEFPIYIKIFQRKCPLQKKNGLVFLKMKLQACITTFTINLLI